MSRCLSPFLLTHQVYPSVALKKLRLLLLKQRLMMLPELLPLLLRELRQEYGSRCSWHGSGMGIGHFVGSLNTLRGIMFEGRPRLFQIHFRLGIEGALGDVLLHEEFVVRPKGTLGLSARCRPLSVEVPVVGNRLATEVAHFSAAGTPHLVASLGLEEGLLAAVALSDQGLGHLVFDVGPLAYLSILLNLVAVQWYVAQLFA